MISDSPRSSRALTALFAAAAFVVIVAGMKSAASLIIPCFLAIFIAVISSPPLAALRRVGCPSWLALVVVVLGLLVVGTGVGAVVTGAVREFNSKSQHYEARVGEIRDRALTRLEEWLPTKTSDLPGEVGPSASDQDLDSSKNPLLLADSEGESGGSVDPDPTVGGTDAESPGVVTDSTAPNDDGVEPETRKAEFAGSAADVRRTLESLDFGIVFQFLSQMLGELSGLLGNALFIVLTVIFILSEASGFPAKIRYAFARSEDVQQVLDRFASSIHQYIAIKSVMSLLTGATIGFWLYLLGVDFPFLWALLAFFLNFIPNLGSVIAAAPAVLVAWVQLGGTTASVAAAGYIVVNFVVGNVLEPRFMGKGLDLSTLVVFVSLVFWGWVFGPIGMLLSVPLTMMIKIGLEASPETRWIAVLLGSGAVEERAPDAPAPS